MSSQARLNAVNKILVSLLFEREKKQNTTLFIEYPNPQELVEITELTVTYKSSLRTRINLAEKTKLRIQKSKTFSLHDFVVLTVSKSRNESKILIAKAFTQVRNDGFLILEGDNKEGIAGTLKLLSDIVRVEKTISISHGKIALIKITKEKKKLFDDWLALERPIKNADGYYTVPGVFSYQKIDSGSLFLANAFKNRLSGKVVDLGAGWGLLSRHALTSNKPIDSIMLIENDKRALKVAKMNILSNNAKFHWADVSDLGNYSNYFNTAICNPPFHDGRKTNIELALSFVTSASKILKRNGSLWLVANIHLPYETHVQKNFSKSYILNQNSLFKIILAKYPK